MRLEFWVFTMLLSVPSLCPFMASYQIRQADVRFNYLYYPCKLPHAVQELDSDPPSIEFFPFLDSTKSRERVQLSHLGVLDLDLVDCYTIRYIISSFELPFSSEHIVLN
jgi:hypothetical protein